MSESASLLTVDDACQYLGDISPSSFYRLVRHQGLPVVDVGTGKRPRIRVSETALQRWVEERHRVD